MFCGKPAVAGPLTQVAVCESVGALTLRSCENTSVLPFPNISSICASVSCSSRPHTTLSYHRFRRNCKDATRAVLNHADMCIHKGLQEAECAIRLACRPDTHLRLAPPSSLGQPFAQLGNTEIDDFELQCNARTSGAGLAVAAQLMQTRRASMPLLRRQ